MPRKKSRPPFMKLYVTNNGMDPDPRDLAAIAGEMLVATSEIARPYSLTLGLTYEVDEKLVDEYMDAVVYPREDAKLYEFLDHAKKHQICGDCKKEDEGWPAAGSVDTELRCLMELEVSNAEKEVQPRVQA